MGGMYLKRIDYLWCLYDDEAYFLFGNSIFWNRPSPIKKSTSILLDLSRVLTLPFRLLGHNYLDVYFMPKLPKINCGYGINKMVLSLEQTNDFYRQPSV